MISFWQHHRVEGTAAGGVIFPGRWGLARDLRIAGEPGIQIAEATTNEVVNSSFTTDTANWTNSGFTTFERSTTRSLYGTASLHCVSDGSGDLASSDLMANADDGETWTASCWVYIVRGDFKLWLIANPSGGTDASATRAVTGSWQFVTCTGTMRAGTTDARIVISPGAVDASEFYVDGVQLEQKAYATPYCDSTLASDGAQGVGGHAAMARTAASLYWPTAKMGGLDRERNTLSVWWRSMLPNTMTNNAYLWSDGTRLLYFRASDDKFVFTEGTNTTASSAQTFSAGDLLHLVVTLNGPGDAAVIYKNGVSIGSGNFFPVNWGTNFFVGSTSTPDTQCNGILAHLSIYNEAKLAADVLAMYNQGPGPFTGCVFYAPLTDSIHGEAGTCIGLDRLSTGPYLRFGNWRPTVPVQTALGIESFERDGVELEVQKYGNVTESMLLHFQNLAAPDTGLKDVKRLGSILHTARMWSESNARGQPGTEAVDLIYRPTGIGRLGRSRVLGWGNSAMTPEQLEFLVSKGRGDVTLSFVREPFWRCAERPLGNSATTIYTQYDASHNNFVAVAGLPSWIEGEIPAPAALWVKNTGATTYGRFVASLIQDRRGDNVTPVPWLDAKDQASNDASAYHNGTAEAADATAASGTRVTINPSVTPNFAVQFDGDDSYCTTADDAAWDIDAAAGGTWTVEFWIYIQQYSTTTADTQRILNNEKSTADAGWYISLSPIVGVHGTGRVDGSTTVSYGNSIKVPSLNKWHHIAMTFQHTAATDSMTREWFVDGKKTSSFTFTIASYTAASNSALIMGARSGGTPPIGATPNYTRYRLAEIRISNSIRYTADFTPATAQVASDGNTLALWHCLEGTGTTIDNAETTASRDFTMTNFSGTAATDWVPGPFSNRVVESQMADYDIPLTMAEQYAGPMVAWCRMKVNAGTVANTTVRGKWNVTGGSYWSVDNKRPGTAAQWEWVELGAIPMPWFAVDDKWIEAGAMDVAALTDINRQFSVYTTFATTTEVLHLDSFLFLPRSGFYANVKGCNMAQNKGLLFDWMARKPRVTKTGTTYYTPVFEAGLDPTATALQVWPGRQAWLHCIFSTATELNTLNDAIDVYPIRYRPLYLALPVDE